MNVTNKHVKISLEKYNIYLQSHS